MIWPRSYDHIVQANILLIK